MSTFVLQLPNSFVDIDNEEMEYVDGGGAITFSISANSVAKLIVGYFTRTAVIAALSGIDATIGAAIIFGTAGAGTFVAAACVTALGVAIPWLATQLVDNYVTGNRNKTVSLTLASGSFVPNFNLSF